LVQYIIYNVWVSDDSNRYRAVKMQTIFWASVLPVMGGAICTTGQCYGHGSCCSTIQLSQKLRDHDVFRLVFSFAWFMLFHAHQG